MNNGWPWENHNPLTQLSKAVALFERASRLAATWRPGAFSLLIHVLFPANFLEEIPNVDSYYSEFVAVDQRIDEFKARLTPVGSVPEPSQQVVHLANCISNGATIQLHSTFCLQNTGSRAKCLAAALAIVRANQAAPVHDRVYTSPILGVSISVFLSNSDLMCAGLAAVGCLWPRHYQRDCRSAIIPR